MRIADLISTRREVYSIPEDTTVHDAARHGRAAAEKFRERLDAGRREPRMVQHGDIGRDCRNSARAAVPFNEREHGGGVEPIGHHQGYVRQPGGGNVRDQAGDVGERGCRKQDVFAA